MARINHVLWKTQKILPTCRWHTVQFTFSLELLPVLVKTKNYSTVWSFPAARYSNQLPSISIPWQSINLIFQVIKIIRFDIKIPGSTAGTCQQKTVYAILDMKSNLEISIQATALIQNHLHNFIFFKSWSKKVNKIT